MKGLNSKKNWESIEICLQVNLFQKHLLLHQLTHNLLSYCGLINIKIEASDKNLSVLSNQKKPIWSNLEGHRLAVLFSRKVAKFEYFDYSG